MGTGGNILTQRGKQKQKTETHGSERYGPAGGGDMVMETQRGKKTRMLVKITRWLTSVMEFGPPKFETCWGDSLH